MSRCTNVGDDFEYVDTQPPCVVPTDTWSVTEQHSDREQAMRKLPLPYSLALRLRDAGVASDVICEYLGIEDASLEGIYRVAAAKLRAAEERNRDRASANPASIEPRSTTIRGVADTRSRCEQVSGRRNTGKFE
jgi:hypothetical protein